MKKCISKVFSAISKLWRTLVSTFVSDKSVQIDLDADGRPDVSINLDVTIEKPNSVTDNTKTFIKED